VPPLIRSVLQAADWSMEHVDALVIHQANRFMLQYLIKSMKLPPEKVVFAMQDFGNTSSASVPLAITASLADKISTRRLRLLLASFGNGFSWGAVALECGPITIPEMRLVADGAVAEHN
jgi:3-oxoacyl-[acyl-carrier-protein] synthase-3